MPSQSSSPFPNAGRSKSKSNISPFQCQRCRIALVPHKSLTDLKPAQFNLLTSSLQLAVDTKQKQQQSIQNQLKGFKGHTTFGSSWPENFDSNTPHVPWGLSNLPDEAQSLLFGRGGPVGSFVALPDTRFLQAEQQKSQLARLAENENSHSNKNDLKDNTNTLGSVSATTTALETLFEIISSRSEIDYPVCMECAEILKDSLKTKYEEECRERDAYISFISQLKSEAEPSEAELKQIKDEIHQLELENEKALEELKQAEYEQEKLDRELKTLQNQYKELSKEEENFYEKQNSFNIEISDLENEKDRVESILELENQTFVRLQKVNVYNDVFCIGFDGYFGTINGLRLGRLKNRMVEWAEINAAWGQTLLLVATIINKLGFKLHGYRLRPQGSMSRIDKFDVDPKTGEYTKVTSLELYSSGDYKFERFLNHKRLDSAMIAFLAVLKQVGDYVEVKDPSIKVPYSISNDKIGDHSIRLSINSSNDSWTTACKFVLTNAKWMLAYVSLS